MGLLLGLCLVVSVGCFAYAGDQNDGSFAVAGAIMAFAFLYCQVNLDKTER